MSRPGWASGEREPDAYRYQQPQTEIVGKRERRRDPDHARMHEILRHNQQECQGCDWHQKIGFRVM